MPSQEFSYREFVDRLNEFEDCVFTYNDQELNNKPYSSCMSVAFKLTNIEPLHTVSGLMFYKSPFVKNPFYHKVTISGIRKVVIETKQAGVYRTIMFECYDESTKTEENFEFFCICTK